MYKDHCCVSLQLEAEATHRAITIGNRVNVLCVSILFKTGADNLLTSMRFLQASCPVYLVNVSSMGAGDVVATAKMQGRRVPSSPYGGCSCYELTFPGHLGWYIYR